MLILVQLIVLIVVLWLGYSIIMTVPMSPKMRPYVQALLYLVGIILLLDFAGMWPYGHPLHMR